MHHQNFLRGEISGGETTGLPSANLDLMGFPVKTGQTGETHLLPVSPGDSSVTVDRSTVTHPSPPKWRKIELRDKVTAMTASHPQTLGDNETHFRKVNQANFRTPWAKRKDPRSKPGSLAEVLDRL